MQKDFPSVFRAMGDFGDDEPMGAKEPDTTSPSEALAETAIASLQQVRAALPGVTTMDGRDTIIELLEEMREMVDRMGWEQMPESMKF